MFQQEDIFSLTPTVTSAVAASWSPITKEQQQQYFGSFDPSHHHHHQQQQHQPFQQVSSVSNDSIDRAFADLINDTSPTPSFLQQLGSPTLAEFQPLFTPTSLQQPAGAPSAVQQLCASVYSLPIITPPKPPLLQQLPSDLGKQKKAKKSSEKKTSAVKQEKQDVAAPKASSASSKFLSELAPSNPARHWTVAFQDAEYKDKLSCLVTSKTRCELPSQEIPGQLYSSLKYEIRQRATGAICCQVPFLLARCTVVDSVDFKEVLKENKNVLKGVIETSIVKPSNALPSDQVLEGALKVQFTDVSFHHNKRDFCFQVSYFTPQNLVKPILIMRSASFKVLARKPSQNKKRKHDSLDFFAKQVEDLVNVSKKLKPSEKKAALELVSSKLLQLDPHFFLAHLSGNKNAAISVPINKVVDEEDEQETGEDLLSDS